MFIIKNKKIFLLISIFLVVASVVIISLFGLKIGIDFKGGALTEVSYPDGRPEISILKDATKDLSLGEITFQPSGTNDYIVKSKDLTDPEHTTLLQALSAKGTLKIEEKNFNSIGPSVGKELKKKSMFSIFFVILAVILFIAYAFRKVSKPISSWKYGPIAIIALLHDITIPIGVMGMLGHFAGAEVDTLFVVALLTILGISVADTIVVFDRIRENLRLKISSDFHETVGRSIDQTFTRSINTSLTVIFVLLSLFFFGPESTRNFALIMTIGLFFGTYSSIFLASPLLVYAYEIQEKMQAKKGNKKNKK
ncbi:MAG: protein translocase subunit SecF [Candidatus Paceibacterota bacterium]|jgi:preprotein translocase subunit SecF